MPELALYVQIHEAPRHRLAPPTFQLSQAELPVCTGIAPEWRPDPLAPAPVVVSSDGDRIRAINAAAVAHLGGPWSRPDDGDARWARGSELDGLEEVITADQAVAADPRSPLLPLDADPQLWWLPVHRLSDRHQRWAPAAALHTGPVRRLLGRVGDRQRPVGQINLVGLAGGSTIDEAVRVALGHVIAHDCLARWWADPNAAEPLRWRTWDDHTELRWLPGTGGVPVVLAVAGDPTTGLQTIGAAADACPETAADRAVASAWHQLTLLDDLSRPDGQLHRTATAWAGAAPLPWRADRRYLDLAPTMSVPGALTPPRPALADPLLALQCGLDPRLQAEVDHRLRATAPPVREPGHGDEPPAVDPVAALADQVWVRELTPGPLAHHGLHAVRVLLPGALRLDAPALPCRALVASDHDLPWPGW